MFNNLVPKPKKSKNSRYIHWLEWVQKLLAKKGIDSDIDSCAYGRTHLVSRAKPVGGGWSFYSQACSGCAASKAGLDAVKKYGIPLPDGAPNCALLSGPLFSLTKVHNGEEFNLPFVATENTNNSIPPAVLRTKKVKRLDSVGEVKTMGHFRLVPKKPVTITPQPLTILPPLNYGNEFSFATDANITLSEETVKELFNNKQIFWKKINE